MNEIYKFSKEWILIESIKVLKRHNATEEQINQMLKEKFNLSDEQIKDIKNKVENENKKGGKI